MKLKDCLILILGRVLRNKPIDTIESSYLYELGEEWLYAQRVALLTITLIGNISVSIEKLIGKFEIEPLCDQVI